MDRLIEGTFIDSNTSCASLVHGFINIFFLIHHIFTGNPRAHQLWTSNGIRPSAPSSTAATPSAAPAPTKLKNHQLHKGISTTTINIPVNYPQILNPIEVFKPQKEEKKKYKKEKS